MSIYESIRRKWPFHQEAAPAAKLLGQPAVRQTTYAPGTIQRNITPALLVADRSVAPVQSAIRGLARLCFAGFTPVFESIDEGDDTKQKQIDECKAEFKRMDGSLGRIGKTKRSGTLKLIEGAFIQGCTFRQSIFEFAHGIEEGGWDNISEIQLLPGETFASAPSDAAGNDRYVPDKILPGVVCDKTEDLAKFYQSQGMGKTQELDPESVIYIEDSTLSEDVSMLRALVPTIEQFKTNREWAMLAVRRAGVPNMNAEVDAKDIASLLQAGYPPENLKVEEMISYGKELVEAQGYETAYGTIPGVHLKYPNISMPLNPWDVDQYLKQEVLNFIFAKDVTESLAQAISVSSSPTKAVIDAIVAAERETWGAPFEKFYNKNWLEANGYDLRVYFEWAEWSAPDKKAEADETRADMTAGLITINEARQRRGYAPLGKVIIDGEEVDERDLLYEEIKARKGGASQVANPE